MRIAYDITQTGIGKAGCGYLAYSLINKLAKIDKQNEYLLLSSFGENYWDKNTSPSACDIHNPKFRHGLRHADHASALQFWRNPPTNLDVALGKPDIVHSNNYYCPTGLKDARLVYTLYDLSFMEHPEWTTEANRLICFNGIFNASLYADMILAISEYSRKHFLRMFPHYQEEKIRVVYPASRYTQILQINRPANLPAFINPKNFWLCVGTLEPRKNYFRLLQAYAQYKKNTKKPVPLVHAGGPGWLMDNFKEKIIELGLEKDVILLGYVDDKTLQWLYQNCFAFIYPSLFEGFGLPVLEAMSLGAAVITSNATSIPEIVGDAGILIDPFNINEITEAMVNLVNNENQYLKYKSKTKDRIDHFSWQKAANETLEIYTSVLSI